MALEKKNVAEMVKSYGKNEKDTGSAAVQVALLTERIKNLSAHLQANHKDQSARRGLSILVGKRRSFLAYIERNDHEEYVALIKKLGIRK